MKVTVLLQKDHEVVRSLLDQLRTLGKDKMSAFEEVHRELLTRLQIEEDLLYGELSRAVAVDATIGDKAQAQHDEIKRLLDEASESEGSKSFEARIMSVIRKIDEHFDFEEDVLLEQVRQSLPEYRLEELGLEMEDRRRFLRLSAA